MSIGARELVEGVQMSIGARSLLYQKLVEGVQMSIAALSVLIAEENCIEVNATAQENIAEENTIEVPCWYTFLGIPPARAAQLHSEAQEAQELHQELQELQEVHQMLQSEVQVQESATADMRGESHGGYVVQAFSKAFGSGLTTGMASRRSRKNGIKKSRRPDKKFKLGKFVSREFKWDSARQHRLYS